MSPSQLTQIDAATTTPTHSQHLPVQPDPDVPQDQGYTHIQQPQQWIPSTRPNPRLVQLPVARLDSKPTSIRLSHPAIRRRLQAASVGIHQRLTTMLTSFPTPIATLYTHCKRGLAFVGVGHGVLPPTASLPGRKDLRPARPLRVVSLTSA